RCASSIPTFRPEREPAIVTAETRFPRTRHDLRPPHRDLPALAGDGAGAIVAVATGATRSLTAEHARELVAKGDVLVCHALFVAARLRARPAIPLFDVLELFAFVKPGVACLPSPS